MGLVFFLQNENRGLGKEVRGAGMYIFISCVIIDGLGCYTKRIRGTLSCQRKELNLNEELVELYKTKVGEAIYSSVF